MRRVASILIAVGFCLGLAACAPAQPKSVTPMPQVVESSPAEAGAQDATVSGTAADDVCATASQSGDAGVCVLEAVNETAALSFTGYRVVKLIGGSYDGAVEIIGAEQVVVTGASMASDITIDARNAVVKMSTIGGSLSVAGGRGATVIENTIGGNLVCADDAEVRGNSVGGDTACAARN